MLFAVLLLFFFFNDTATTEIYTLSLHDALPISWKSHCGRVSTRGSSGRSTVRPHWRGNRRQMQAAGWLPWARGDRKSTRLNSSHSQISYAVFCLKKKN